MNGAVYHGSAMWYFAWFHLFFPHCCQSCRGSFGLFDIKNWSLVTAVLVDHTREILIGSLLYITLFPMYVKWHKTIRLVEKNQHASTDSRRMSQYSNTFSFNDGHNNN